MGPARGLLRAGLTHNKAVWVTRAVHPHQHFHVHLARDSNAEIVEFAIRSFAPAADTPVRLTAVCTETS